MNCTQTVGMNDSFHFQDKIMEFGKIQSKYFYTNYAYKRGYLFDIYLYHLDENALNYKSLKFVVGSILAGPLGPSSKYYCTTSQSFRALLILSDVVYPVIR